MMYIVVIVEPYYPSVFHFTDEKEAKIFFEKKKIELGYVVHLAKVKESHFNSQEDFYNHEEDRYYSQDDFLEDVELMDVEWYIYR